MHAKILIIEPERKLSEILQARLTAAEYDVTVIGDEIDAFSSIAANIPDIIIMPAVLPNINGFDVARRLKNSEETRFIPIIMMSELNNSDDKTFAYDIGIDDYLVKPVDVEDVIHRVNSLLRIRWLYKNLIDECQEIQAAYEAIRTSEALYRSVFDSLPIATFVLNPGDFTILYANSCMLQLTQYDAGSLNSNSINLLCPDTGWLNSLCGLIAYTSHTGKTPESVYEVGDIFASDGERILVDAYASSILFENKRAISLSLIDRRRYDASVKQLIENAKITMLREMAIAVNSKVNDPLFVILNDVASLQSSLCGADPVVFSRLARILEAAQRIQRVTSQLSAINNPVSRDYLPGVRMLDLDGSIGMTGDSN